MSTSSPTALLGIAAPEFSLPDVTTGAIVSLADFSEKRALLVMFICRHCPYVQHVRDELGRLGRDYLPRSVGIVGISSNDAAAYPEDSPESLREMAAEWGLLYPVCYDESQETARAYGAVCTPDAFLYDAARQLVYRGRLDDSRPGSGRPVDGRELRAALDAVLDGRGVDSTQHPSVGCGIKWREPPG